MNPKNHKIVQKNAGENCLIQGAKKNGILASTSKNLRQALILFLSHNSSHAHHALIGEVRPPLFFARVEEDGRHQCIQLLRETTYSSPLTKYGGAGTPDHLVLEMPRNVVWWK